YTIDAFKEREGLVGAIASRPVSSAQPPPASVPECLFGIKADPDSGSTSYLVKWEGEKFADSTWETNNHLLNPRYTDAFHALSDEDQLGLEEQLTRECEAEAERELEEERVKRAAEKEANALKYARRKKARELQRERARRAAERGDDDDDDESSEEERPLPRTGRKARAPPPVPRPLTGEIDDDDIILMNDDNDGRGAGRGDEDIDEFVVSSTRKEVRREKIKATKARKAEVKASRSENMKRARTGRSSDSDPFSSSSSSSPSTTPPPSGGSAASFQPRSRSNSAASTSSVKPTHLASNWRINGEVICVCGWCGARYNSARAMGGHVKAHAQVPDYPIMPRPGGAIVAGIVADGGVEVKFLGAAGAVHEEQSASSSSSGEDEMEEMEE
ncbi:hypothetical protein TeGR_g2248, partial [Tetraparma gracilis]